uniref:PDZ domain-containing protein n=1 Tax=Heterorhabditis bacteriophora TaxID=37862 RepID=A0A1I7XKV3_HETBA
MSRVADYGVQEKSKKPNSCKEALFGKRARKWAFFFIVAFLAALTIKDVVDLFLEYSEDPKESDMNIVFNDSMTMPNITFCMSKQQAWSHFAINESASVTEWDMVVDESLSNMTDHKNFLGNPWDYRLVMEAYDMISTYNSLERETTAHGSARSINIFKTSPRLAGKRKTFKVKIYFIIILKIIVSLNINLLQKWMDILASRNVTFEEFTQKTGTEVLRRSMQRFQRITFDEDLVIKTKLRTSWISQMQICFQPWFDEDNFHTIDDQGNFFTMLLSHNAEHLNGSSLECMSVDFHGRPSSLNRFMEGKGRARDGFTFELCAGQRHEVSVEVRALYQMLENNEPGKACRDVEQGEDSEFDCRSRCRMEMIRDMCKCTALSLSYLAKNDLDKFPLCDYTTCEVDVTMSCYYKSYTVLKSIMRSDLTLINLNWGSFEYLTMEQQWKYSLTAFIAALGGSIGMWLGLSILSLIQVRYINNKILFQHISSIRHYELFNTNIFINIPFMALFVNEEDILTRNELDNSIVDLTGNDTLNSRGMHLDELLSEASDSSVNINEINSSTSIIELPKGSQGFGFNIVGGVDSPHIPGECGIFVSMVKKDGPAYLDGRIKEGDKVLAINGIDLANRTHDEVVTIFRNLKENVAKLLVESGAENRIINEQTPAISHSLLSKFSDIADEAKIAAASMSFIHNNSDFLPSFSPILMVCDDVATAREDDSESVTSYAPSMHSIIDDVPRTPKKPMSLLDPRNPSVFTETLYVSIGLAVITLGGFFVYRMLKGRR